MRKFILPKIWSMVSYVGGTQPILATIIIIIMNKNETNKQSVNPRNTNK